MYLSNRSTSAVQLGEHEEASVTRAEILKAAGDHAGAAPIGTVRGTKGAGVRR
jgi:hypothetical protein